MCMDGFVIGEFGGSYEGMPRYGAWKSISIISCLVSSYILYSRGMRGALFKASH